MKTRLNLFAMALVASATSNARADAIDVDSALRSIIANNPAVQAEIFRRLSNGSAIPHGVSLGNVVFKGILSGAIEFPENTRLPLNPVVAGTSFIYNCGTTQTGESVTLKGSTMISQKWEHARELTSKNGLISIATTLKQPPTGDALFDQTTTTINSTSSYEKNETRSLDRTETLTIAPWTKATAVLRYSMNSTSGLPYTAKFTYAGKVEVSFVREGEINGTQIHRNADYCLTATPPILGSMVRIDACNRAERFKFDNTEGAIYRKDFGCLTGPGLPGKPLHMEECNGRNQNQRWRRNPDGTISGSPGNRLCLAASGQSGVVVQECSSRAADQQWKIDGYEVVRGEIKLDDFIPEAAARTISTDGTFSGNVVNYNSILKKIDDPIPLSPNSPDCQPEFARSANVLRGKSPNLLIRRATPDELKAAKPMRSRTTTGGARQIP